MKKFLLYVCSFMSLTAMAQDCSSLFISEYVEGIGNNKALEIYNPTSEDVNLGEYFLMRLNNGDASMRPFGVANSNCHQLPAVQLAPYASFVVVLDRTVGTESDPAVWDELLEKADVLMSSSYEVNNTMNFNGNDALVLAKGLANDPDPTNAVMVDIFGKPGENPARTNVTPQRNGWSTVAPYNNSAFVTNGNTADVDVTKDHVMIRKSTVKVGKKNIVQIMQTPFNPLADWDSFPPRHPKRDDNGNIIYQTDFPTTPQWVGNWGTLGWHSCECDPNMATFNAELENIEMYPNPTTGVVTLSNIEAITVIEVRNALGQLVQTVSNQGKNIISVEINDKSGVYFVTIKDKAGLSATRKLIVK